MLIQPAAETEIHPAIIELAQELAQRHTLSRSAARLLASRILATGQNLSRIEIAHRAGIVRNTAWLIRQTQAYQDAYNQESWERELADYRPEITRKLREKAIEGHKDELLAVGRTIGVITPEQVQVSMVVTDTRSAALEQSMRSLLHLPMVLQDVDVRMITEGDDE